MSKKAKRLKTGIYQHYKGDMYEVVGLGYHTETEEELVFYRALEGSQAFWARPLKMFVSNTTINGEEKPRFQYLGQTGAIEAIKAL